MSVYVNNRNLQFALIDVVPLWLQYLSTRMVLLAKVSGSSLDRKSRKFSISRSNDITNNIFRSTISCTGNYVEQLAWDLTFNVPVGGFKYGDIDPITGEPFPGGKNKRGTFISLVDKPQVEGEKIKSVSRTYSKHSGKVITKVGFFDEAIRTHIGNETSLNSIAAGNLQTLALLTGKSMAHAIGNQVKFECAKKGLSCTVDGPSVITISF